MSSPINDASYKQLEKFISFLLEPEEENPSSIILVAISSDKQIVSIPLPLDNFIVANIANKIHSIYHHQNLFFSICGHSPQKFEELAKNRPNTRGDAQTVTSVPGAWLDIDIAGTNHKEQNLVKSPEEAMEIIHQTSPFAPSIVINSGGGFHVYYKFKEPFIITNESDRIQVQALLKRLHYKFAQAFLEKGYKIDNVSNLAFILRLPGSYNLKNEKVMVQIEESHSSYKAYEYREIEDFVSDIELNEINVSSNFCQSYSVSDIGNIIEDINDACPFMDYLYHNQAQIPEPLWYPGLSNLARITPGGIDLCHRYSENYPGYSQQSTQKKIIHALNASGPISCTRIQELGFDGCDDCGVKSPIVAINRKLGIGTSNTGHNSFEIQKLHGLTVPDNYEIDGGKVFFLRKTKKGETQREIVIQHPIWVAERITLLQSGEMVIRLGFELNQRVKHIEISRKTIAKSSEITDLANKSVFVNSDNAKKLSAFLMALELDNLAIIPEIIGVSSFGWMKVGDTKCFVFPEGCITRDGNDNDASKNVKVIFPDQETKIVASGIGKKGKFEKWKSALNLANPFPYVKTVVIAALASPLLEAAGLENFVIHLGYPSSAGKTIALRIAMSCLGDPRRLVLNWNATPVGVERTSAMLNHLPIALNETKSIKNRDKATVIRNIIYQHSEGVGRTRGNKTGQIQQTPRWNNIMLSTGESNISALVEDGGIRARVLDLPGKPFKEKSHEMKKLVEKLESAVSDNYGHAFPAFIQSILDHPDSLVSLKNRINELKEETSGKLPVGVGGRLGNIVAFLIASGELVIEILDLEWDLEDVKETLLSCATQVATEESEGVRAANFAYSFAVANREKDLNRKVLDTVTFRGSTIGRFDGNELQFIKSELSKILKENGFSPNGIYKEWLDKGWIETTNSKDHAFSTQRTIQHKRDWCVVLNEKCLNSILAESPKATANVDNIFLFNSMEEMCSHYEASYHMASNLADRFLSELTFKKMELIEKKLSTFEKEFPQLVDTKKGEDITDF
jgi:uncharacterized protein (DUF927 family)